MEQAPNLKVFYLPTHLRSSKMPPLTKNTGKYWHTGIIYGGIVYECLDGGLKNVKSYAIRSAYLEKNGAVFYDCHVDQISEKIADYLGRGLNNQNFVELILDKPLTTTDEVINYFEE
jgi:hypothetical protein